MSKPKPYKTSDTPYAAFLHYHGLVPVVMRQDPNDVKRLVFVFVYQDIIPELEQTYNYGKPDVDAKKYHKSLKIVTRMVKEAQNG